MTNAATERLGRLGVWSNFDHQSGSVLRAFSQRVEQHGFDARWVQEGAGREPFAALGALAVSTERIALGVGIASIYARDAVASHAAALTLAELSGGRFVLGLGVSHARRVEGERAGSGQDSRRLSSQIASRRHAGGGAKCEANSRLICKGRQ